mmetsp:Transcript_32784/g.68938  ORF Transcript_32784/g.68938 Transcript_32784/m.68938 type:complete len:206 (+) Transcript_32784:275-892(+)
MISPIKMSNPSWPPFIFVDGSIDAVATYSSMTLGVGIMMMMWICPWNPFGKRDSRNVCLFGKYRMGNMISMSWLAHLHPTAKLQQQQQQHYGHQISVDSTSPLICHFHSTDNGPDMILIPPIPFTPLPHSNPPKKYTATIKPLYHYLPSFHSSHNNYYNQCFCFNYCVSCCGVWMNIGCMPYSPCLHCYCLRVCRRLIDGRVSRG